MSNKSSRNNQDVDTNAKRPFIVGKDLSMLLSLIFVGPFSWIMPVKFWRGFSLLLAYCHTHIFIKRSQTRIKEIERIYGSEVKGYAPSKIEIHRVASTIEQMLQYFREYRPGGWTPHIELFGRKHVEGALENGRGGILWIAPFFFNNLIVKKGFSKAGLPVSHLSAFFHGPSPSRFGINYINPVWIMAENKYIDERIVIQPWRKLIYKRPGNKMGHIRKIESRLQANGLVLMGCEPTLSQKGVEQTVLKGKFTFATGAPSLALANGSALLPVFTISKKPNSFEVNIEAPLVMPDTMGRHEVINMLINNYARLIESYVGQNPTLLRPWDYFGVD